MMLQVLMLDNIQHMQKSNCIEITGISFIGSSESAGGAKIGFLTVIVFIQSCKHPVGATFSSKWIWPR